MGDHSHAVALKPSWTALLGVVMLMMIPGQAAALDVTIQAEDYSNMSGVQTEATSDTGGGYNVGWIDAGDWMAYANVNIPASGSYVVEYRVASLNGGGTLSLDLNGGSVVLGQLNVPSTGGWQNWTTIQHTVSINAGTYSVGIYAVAGGWNLNWFRIRDAANNIVCFYEHIDYGGASFCHTSTGDFSSVPSGWNDRVSSLQVASGYSVQIFEHGNFGGASQTYTGNVSFVGAAMNDKMSSYKIMSGGSSSGSSSGSFDPGNPSATGTHGRLIIRNGCSNQTMWVQWLASPGFTGGVFNGPQRVAVAANNTITYQIPDKGISSLRFWPGYECDSNGHNCRVGASGGPQEFGFTCPSEGCAPPIDSKFEATFGCITGINPSQCQENPSAPGTPLGRNDWWNTSAVDGYTSGFKVQVNGYCPTGPIHEGDFAGPGGPPDGVINCLGLNMNGCPTNENLSTNGQFPALSSMNLRLTHPTRGGYAGCYSPVGKLTYGNWGNSPVYLPTDAQAQWYACPTPPITPTQCMAGPAEYTQFKSYVHSVCPTYTYAYDDGVGLSTCPASTLTTYEVTFGCPPQ